MPPAPVPAPPTPDTLLDETTLLDELTSPTPDPDALSITTSGEQAAHRATSETSEAIFL